jgi:hypothetical protein
MSSAYSVLSDLAKAPDLSHRGGCLTGRTVWLGPRSAGGVNSVAHSIQLSSKAAEARSSKNGSNAHHLPIRINFSRPKPTEYNRRQ